MKYKNLSKSFLQHKNMKDLFETTDPDNIINFLGEKKRHSVKDSGP